MKYIRYSLGFLLITAMSQAASITNLSFNKTTLQTYEKLEASFQLSQVYSNPYDPAVIQVDALISDGGAEIAFPCFYFAPVKNYSSFEEDFSKAGWRLRYSFTKTGSYTIRFRVADRDTTTFSEPTAIAVSASDRKGFIRINPNDKQCLKFDNGQPYHPIGYNAAWASFSTYQNYIKKMNENGMSHLRYWLIGFANQELEWDGNYGWTTGYGLGKYSQRVGAMLDSLISLAEKKNVFFQLTFESHGEWSTKVDPNWSTNPYNINKGGFLNSPAELFTNAQARQMTKNRYRYIIARWAYSPAVFAWEFFNEVNYTDAYYVYGKVKEIADWHNEMSDYIKSIDPIRHILTTSTDRDEFMLAFEPQATSLDQIQYHRYSDGICEMILNRSQFLLDRVSKPLLCGEFGNGSYDFIANPTNQGFLEGDHLRKTTWQSMMLKVPALYWAWDNVDEHNWYHLYKPIAALFGGISLEGIETFHPSLKNFEGDVRETSLKDFTRAFVYLYDGPQDFMAEATARTVSGGRVQITELEAGEYELLFANPRSAVLSTQSITLSGNTADIPIPDFKEDLALRLMKNEPLTDLTPPYFTEFPETTYTVYDTVTTLQLQTSERAFVRYSLADEAFENMPFGFAQGEGGVLHSSPLRVEHGQSYQFFVRAKDLRGNVMDTSAVISFVVNTSIKPAEWTHWRYDDSSWKKGAAPLGYGNGTDATEVDSAHTVYFRQEFFVNDTGAVAYLATAIKCHDGAALYLNGHEIARFNMLAFGYVEYETDALSDVKTSESVSLPVATLKYLRAGINVLAVELHQTKSESPNISLDLRFYADNQTFIKPGSEWRYFDAGYRPGRQIVNLPGDYGKNKLPQQFRLHQNYPNPFNPETTISFELPKEDQVRLAIYSLSGAKISTLIDGHRPAGLQSVRWNGKDEQGRAAATGVYLYWLQAENAGVRCRKMLLLR